MAAHAILMNGGNYIKPHTISKVSFRNGSSEPLTPYYEPNNVLSPQAAYLAAQLMYTAVHGGVYNYLDILARNYATYGKTGTSDWGDEGLQYNIPQGASKDKWMVCDTSEYTIVTWVGYEKGVKDKDTYFSREKSSLNIPGHICSLVLDSLNRDHQPAELARPDGISSITHILGTWPYAAPVADMDSSLITTGLVKSEFATLASPESGDDIKNLSGFHAELASDGSVACEWDEYPDPERMSRSDGTMDISLRNSNGDVIVEAYGAKLFDWSWVYGPIRYRARISQNGETLGEITSETNTASQTFDLKPDTDTQACGFYVYENSGKSSNEVCVTFRTPKAPQPEQTPEPESGDTETKEDSQQESPESTETNG